MTKKELVALTKATWEPYAGHPINDDEAEEIIMNTTGLLRLLLDWNSDTTDAPMDQARDGRAGVPALDKRA